MRTNLGTYQLMTTAAKKVGGPAMLAAILIVGGMFVGALVVEWKNYLQAEKNNGDVLDAKEVSYV